jgi:4-hydroxythreonine-4-phosphate dehydrogenase
VSTLPCIAITMGDPAGVGPELCLRALAEPSVLAVCRPIIYGDAEILHAAADRLGLRAPDRASVLDFALLPLAGLTPGVISAATGQAAYAYFTRAIDDALAGSVDAITTAPINKEALHLGGIRFPGHTEILASRTHAARSCMMQYSEEITCTFVTTHVGYRDVPALLTIERITDVIDLTVEALRRLRGREPRLVICGLNPHAGEHGLFGDREEERIIMPAVYAARARGVIIEGPVPPDTAFLPWKREVTDAFVCMYHDQGHIPLKALAFDHAVNTTLGLPIIRTSVDHGTALEIAWQGKAHPGSLYAALRLAAKLANEDAACDRPR